MEVLWFWNKTWMFVLVNYVVKYGFFFIDHMINDQYINSSFTLDKSVC